jgi:hypothetical protein
MVHVDYQNRDGGILARSLKKLCAINTFVPLIHLPHLTLLILMLAIITKKKFFLVIINNTKEIKTVL